MKTPTQIPVTKTILPALRAAGVKISIEHQRYLHGRGIVETLLTPWARKREKRGFVDVYPFPHGGETTVNLIFPDGKSYTGVATCSLEDRFDRKLGISLALHRALDARKRFKRIKDSPMALVITGSRIIDPLSHDNS